MGRWTQYDEDSYRLPEGMVRVGYDSDTQQYTFKDTSDNTTWTSAPGCEYGSLTKTSRRPLPTPNNDYMFGNGPAPSGSRPGGSAWKLEQLAAQQQIHKKEVKPCWQILASFLRSLCLLPVSAYRSLRLELAANHVSIEPGRYQEIGCRSRHHTTRRHILGQCRESRFKVQRGQSTKSRYEMKI